MSDHVAGIRGAATGRTITVLLWCVQALLAFVFVNASPRSAFAARSKLSTRPDSSHCSNANGIVTLRFVSMRGAQNTSVRWTAVKGTG